MRRKHKKLLISGVAVTAAGVIAAEALLQTSISVQASAAMMPGIEEIIQNASETEEPFRILEIVDSLDQAEIGYYVSGQEPFLKLYKYKDKDKDNNEISFSSVEEGLSILPTENLRKAFVNNLKVNEDGTIDENGKTGIRKLTNDVVGSVTEGYDTHPLLYEDYQEDYFMGDQDGWKTIDIVDSNGEPRKDTVKIRGIYKKNTGSNGDYKKIEEEYYPIRNVEGNNGKTDIDGSSKVFMENIQSFGFIPGREAEAGYYLEFESVPNTVINNDIETGKRGIKSEYDLSENKFGLFENVYTDLTKEISENISGQQFTVANDGKTTIIDEAITDGADGTTERTVNGTPTDGNNGTTDGTANGITTDSNNGTTTETVNGTPTETGNGITEETANGTPTETGSGTTTESGNGTTEETANGTPTETSSGTTTESGNGTTEETGNGTTTETGNGTTEETGNGTTEETGNRTTEETGNGTTTETGNGTTEETGNGTTEETGNGTTTETRSGTPTETGNGTTTNDNKKFLFPGENPERPSSAREIYDFSSSATWVASSKANFSSPVEQPVNEDASVLTDDTTENTVQQSMSSLTGELQSSEPEISDGEFSSGAVGNDSFAEDSFSSGQFDFQADQGAFEWTENQQQELFESSTDELVQPEFQIQEQPDISLQQDSEFDSNEIDLNDNDLFSAESQVINPKYENEGTAGTSENPRIYISESLTSFPGHKYILIGDLKYIIQKQQDCNQTVQTDGDITLQYNGNDSWNYLYWTKNATTGKFESTELLIVTGRRYVDVKDVKKIDENFGANNYYYRVNKVYFCCTKLQNSDNNDPKDYVYNGWYYPFYQNGEKYIEVEKDDERATYYTLEDKYELTPGTGDYDFVRDDSKEEREVEVNHLCYKGGYINNDWLKRYVFNLSPDDPDETVRKQFHDFQIQVDTLKTDELEKLTVPSGEAVASSFTDTENHDFSDSADTQNEFLEPNSEGTEQTQTDQTQTEQTQTEQSQTDLPQTDGRSASEQQLTESSEAPAFSSDAETEEVSVPVSYAQEILGLETAQAAAHEEETENTAVAADFTELETSLVDNPSTPQESDAQLQDISEADQNAQNSDTNADFTQYSESEPDNQPQNEQDTDIQIENSTDGFQADFSDEFTDSADTDTSDIEFSSGEEVFSAAETDTKTGENLTLEDYDLIYLNGSISKSVAQKIVDNRIPVIINQSIIGTASDITQAFNYYLKDQSTDTDQHYVSQFVYVFNVKNSDENIFLLNLDFNTDFSGDPSASQGFEEITAYIKTENEYRKLGSTSNTNVNRVFTNNAPAAESTFTDNASAAESTFTDNVPEVESTFIDNATATSISLLESRLSQARAIEYIINYKYKRIVDLKNKINVLEIQPVDSIEADKLSSETVANWLVGYPYLTNASSSSVDHNRNVPSKALDGNINTFWQSAWQPPVDQIYGDQRNKNPWIQVEIIGDPAKIKGIRFTRRQNQEENHESQISLYQIDIYNEKMEIIYSQTGKMSEADYYQNTKAKGIIFKTPLDAGAKYIRLTDIRSEFNKDSLRAATCAELDIIYYTDNINEIIEQRNKLMDKIHITTMSSAEYVGHVDDINAKYDVIYISDAYEKRMDFLMGDEPMLYSHVGSEAVLKTNYMGQLNGDYSKAENGKFIFNNNVRTAKARGSGNDITEQQYKELMDFVRSGYPVVFADIFVSGRAINIDYVDNSSYMYQFMNEALEYDNVMTEYQAWKGTGNFDFYVQLGKPEIVFSRENGRPAEVIRYVVDENGNEVKIPSGTLFYDANKKPVGVYGNIDGELRYKFTINRTSEISPVNTRYDCKLYFDLNFDGDFSEKLEGQEDYIEIRDSEGIVQSRVGFSDGTTGYQLKSGIEYTLIRIIPSDYFKTIAWKLEVLEAGNPSIRTSVIGYSKQDIDKNKVPVINILNILPNGSGNWDLKAKAETNDDFKYLLGKVEDFKLKFFSINAKAFGEDPDTYLNGKQMLVIGFKDVYPNISEKGINAVQEFIKKGYSVIFSHDTTSFVNYDYTQLNNTNGIYKGDWGLSMNKVLRSLVGMDRYGITNMNTTIKSEDTCLSLLLKKGKDLTNRSISIDGKTTTLFDEILSGAGDIAYKSNGERKESYLSTQGYSNRMLASDQGNNDAIQNVTKVNDGIITQYPFLLDDNLGVAPTHEQYYQLALEEDCDINGISDGRNDIVVWYCLEKRTDGKNVHNTRNDVRNNYYFYSKGNVIYTGAGHKSVNKKSEMKLFINAMVAAASITAVEPQVTFISELNPAAQEETVRYYMTDQMQSLDNTEGNVLEKDIPLYINVKDYNMISSSLNAEDSKAKMTAAFYIKDDINGSPLKDKDLPDELKDLKVTDLTEKLEVLIPYGNEKPIHVSVESGDELGDGSGDESGKKSSVFKFESNNAYQINVKDIEQYLKNPAGSYNSNVKVFVKITSTVKLYGADKTSSSWASIDLKQRQLFDLD